MAWTVKFRLYRDKPLTDAERALIPVPFREDTPPDDALAFADTTFPDEAWEEVEGYLAKMNGFAKLRKELGFRMKLFDDKRLTKYHYKFGYIIKDREPVEPPKPESTGLRALRIRELVDKDPEAARPLLLRELAANDPDSASTLIAGIAILGDLGRELLDQALTRGYYADLAIFAAEELRADDPAWWLRQLGHHSHEVRVHAAKWLRKKQHPQARAATAAVWDSIDHHRRVDFDNLERAFAAESLGLVSKYTIDWRAALGNEPWLDLPALPSAIDLLFEPDILLRRQGVIELSKDKDLRHLRLLSRFHAAGLLLSDPLEDWMRTVPRGDLSKDAFRQIWNTPAERAAWIEQNAPPDPELTDRPLPTNAKLTIEL